MKKYNISDFTGGWFIGWFEPTLKDTSRFEVGVKYYKAGDRELKHYHRHATEYTVIVIGKVRMNGVEYNEKDIIVIDPMDSTDFEVIEDTITTVVKIPSVPGDKFLDTI